jgi:hypothetical protein
MTGQPLTDQSLMPFGLHKGTKLANVPASYLLWVYDNLTLRPDLKKYIDENRDALLMEKSMSDRESRK